MSSDDRPQPDDINRRLMAKLLSGGILAAGAVASSAAQAAEAESAAQPKTYPPGTLGSAGAGPDRPKIAMLVHPKMVMQDLIGPLTVFNLMRCEIHLVWKTREPVMTEVGLPITPTTLFRDCPDHLDVLFSPGGLEGTIAAMQDPEVLGFFADRGRTARYVTSDCTGSLVLGAAGLLRGYKATSHWSVRDQLALMGATPVHERVVHDRNRITGGGVTAGIDFGLTLAALLRSREEAEGIQLIIEYAPAPPFNAGTPETAPKVVFDRLAASRAPMEERARQTALRAGASFKD
jgi:cyclohexyl-isocyanide hydratase